MTLFQNRLKDAARATEATLDRFLSPRMEADAPRAPDRLVDAMRYAVLGPGKRLRPFLLIEAAGICGGAGEAPVEAAAALECIHAYSLVHDDLPAMDDDDIRRGRPTLHRAFDEATAILAGDALLTMAFEILGGLDAPPAVRTELMVMQARAAGAAGMVGGQMLDLAAGVAWDEPRLRAMQRLKTGALFAYATEAGALLGGGCSEDRERLHRFGVHFGGAFQLADDIDDAETDAAAGRPSLVTFLGAEKAGLLLRREADAARAALGPYGERAAALVGAARSVARLS